MRDFEKGNRVEHPSFGKGTFRSYERSPAAMAIVGHYSKAWVMFDDYSEDGFVAVEESRLKPLGPGPKPEPYLVLRGNDLSLFYHFVNGENFWVPSVKKAWTNNNPSTPFTIPLSEITEALDE